MDATAMPRRISLKWLESKKAQLGFTAKTVDGEPNPNRVTLETEYNQAIEERQRWETFEAWVKRALGASVNQYPVSGHEAGKVFLAIDKTTKAKTVYTFEEAWDRFAKANS